MTEKKLFRTCGKRAGIVLGVGTALLLGLMIAPRSAAAQQEQIVSAEQASQLVTVNSVRTDDDGTVSGTLVNRSNHTLRNVQLMIDHAWMWEDEIHPGSDSPGRTDFYTVGKSIPPNSNVNFEYRTSPPLPHRADGYFKTRVKVASFTEVG